MESWPWLVLLLTTFFVLGVWAAEVTISAWFTRYLALATYGFLLGAGVNVIIQGLLSRLQGLNWTFQSPILFSLGTSLFGFLGALIFVTHGDQIRKIFPSSSFSQGKDKVKGTFHQLSIVLWIVASLVALGFCINLVIILKFFSEIETANPLRKPLWFSVGAIIFVFVAAVFARRNLLRLGQILLPGLIAGLVWASIVRDLFIGFYLKYPEFPLSIEVLDVLLVVNFCLVGTAWLNKAAYDSQ